MVNTELAPKQQHFTWHQPCNNQRALSIHHFRGAWLNGEQPGAWLNGVDRTYVETAAFHVAPAMQNPKSAISQYTTSVDINKFAL